MCMIRKMFVLLTLASVLAFAADDPVSAIKKKDEAVIIPTGLMRKMGETFTLVKTPTTNASSAATRNM